MILAAGFGTRLLPYTTNCPKPLFPILNKPLLLLTVKRLQRFGFDPIVVNCHHLAYQIVKALEGVEGVIVQQEDTILGTGGGLRLAASSFRNEPVLITNGDIYHTVNFRDLYQFHQDSASEVSMAMLDSPRFNSVEVDNGRVVAINETKSQHLLAFTGLHVINRDLLFEIPENCFSSIIDLYKQILTQGRSVSSLRVDDCYWTDMGTVKDYLLLHGLLLQKKIKCWRELGKISDSPFLFDDQAECESDLSLHQWACVGSATIGRGVSLARSVVWDGAIISDRSSFKDTIVSNLNP